MKPAPFILHRPKTKEEAVTLLAELGDEGGLVLAGGQSLVPMMALRVAYPPHLVDINGVSEFANLSTEGGRLSIGATIRHARFHRPVEAGCLGELLATVSRHIAHYPIRQRGTFCGSLAHADPASEWCLVARTLDAGIHLASAAGERVVPAEAFFEGAMTTVRNADEILVRATLPILPAGTTFGFYEFNRRAGDFALGMSLVTFGIKDGRMMDVRVGVGGIEENPRRVGPAEAALEGQEPTTEAFEAAAAAAAGDVDPMEDASTSAEYRRDLCAVVVRRALQAALARAASQH
jgi:carbon-monoxide dehydrogenase medium subunit